VWQTDRLDRGSTPWRFGLLGLTLGALVLTVPLDLALVPVLGGWMLLARRATPGQVLAMLLALTVAVVPWVARNRLVLKAPADIATSGGYALLVGNGSNVRPGLSTDLRWPKGVREQVAGTGEVERDRILGEAAVHWMKENPGQAAALYLRKLLHWFAFRNDLVSDRLVPGGSGAGPPWLRDLVMLLGYGLLLGILGTRLILVRRYPLSPLEGLLLALYLGAGLAYATYFTRIRFRVPFDWLLIAIDALFVARLVAKATPEPPRVRDSPPAEGDR
jgi:hypothetical protein